MVRWYQGFLCIGNASHIVDEIAFLVRHHDIGKYVPLLRLEKRPQRQFYLFLAIEGAEFGHIPEPVEATLYRILASRCQPVPVPLLFEQIKSMVGAEHDVRDYVRHIPFRHAPVPDFLDPFDVTIMSPDSAITSPESLVRTERHNRLLAWLSAQGSGSWQIFLSSCRALGLDTPTGEPQRLLRRLRLLGHIETSLDGSAWCIAPTVLVAVGPAGDTFFLAGQRDQILLDTLKSRAEVKESPQVRGDAPATIAIGTTDIQGLVTTVSGLVRPSRVTYGGDVAGRLATVVPSLDGWVDLLQPVEGLVPGLFSLTRFDGEGFTEAVFDGTSGLYQFWLRAIAEESQSRPRFTLYFDQARKQWLRGDWYGLRFLAQHALEEGPTFSYDASSAWLAIPMAFRWPELYERVLVLSSGHLPVYRGAWLYYEAIDHSLLKHLATKLKIQSTEE